MALVHFAQDQQITAPHGNDRKPATAWQAEEVAAEGLSHQGVLRQLPYTPDHRDQALQSLSSRSTTCHEAGPPLGLYCKLFLLESRRSNINKNQRKQQECL